MNIAEEENATRLREIAGSEPRYPVIIWGKKLLFQAPGCRNWRSTSGCAIVSRRKPMMSLFSGQGRRDWARPSVRPPKASQPWCSTEIGPGGQASSSSKIENYAGFPNGVTGRQLAQLSYLQALKFGAEFVAPCHVTELKRYGDGLYQVRTSEDDVAIGKTVIIRDGCFLPLARRGRIKRLARFRLYYNATAVEARMCKGWPVHVIGAGNSAGQAAMFFTQYARKVTLVVRGGDLRKSMSSYLCDRVVANPQIEVRYHTQVTGIEGTEHVGAVHLRDEDGNVVREDTTGLFIFIGAKPRRISCRPSWRATTGFCF